MFASHLFAEQKWLIIIIHGGQPFYPHIFR